MSAGLIEALSAETLHFPGEEQHQMSCIFVNLLLCIETLALVACAELKTLHVFGYE